MAQMKNQGGNGLGGSGKFLEEVGFQKDRPRTGGLGMDGWREPARAVRRMPYVAGSSEHAGAAGREGLMSWVGPGAWWGAGDKAKGRPGASVQP